eukprot:6175192-Pleurochrysis_carterae.AAC.2
MSNMHPVHVLGASKGCMRCPPIQLLFAADERTFIFICFGMGVLATLGCLLASSWVLMETEVTCPSKHPQRQIRLRASGLPLTVNACKQPEARPAYALAMLLTPLISDVFASRAREYALLILGKQSHMWACFALSAKCCPPSLSWHSECSGEGVRQFLSDTPPVEQLVLAAVDEGSSTWRYIHICISLWLVWPGGHHRHLDDRLDDVPRLL